MCKFTNRLFVFAIIGFLCAEVCIEASPCSKLRKCDASKESGDSNYGLIIDQRQKGETNFRIKMDGFVFAFNEPSTNDLLNIGETLLENLGEEIDLHSSLNPNKTTGSQNYLKLSGKDFRANQQTDSPQKIEAATKTNENMEPKIVQEPEAQTKLRIYRLFNLLQKSREK